MKPWEFDRLTIAELNGMVEAKAKQQQDWWKRFHELLAWQTMHLMNATGNFETPVTMDKLLGTEVVETPEEKRKKLAKIKKDQDRAKRRRTR